MSLSGIGLAALEERLRQDLLLIDLPARDWLVAPVDHEATFLPVVIVGGGMGGLVAAAALKLLGVPALIFDKAAAGAEGPWATTALMETLRSPKQVTGPALDLPALTFAAWYQAQFGSDAWDALDKIPRLQWAAYLRWYRQVLALDVRNGHRVVSVRPTGDGYVHLEVEHDGTLQRFHVGRVILANGMDGFGGPRLPDWVKTLPRERWSHSVEPFDYATLAGCHVAVMGASAGAMDASATALEAGAARVDVLIRRDDFPRINYAKAAGGPAMEYGYADLADAWKRRLAGFIEQVGLPPPRASVLRVSRHDRAHFVFDCAIDQMQVVDGKLRLRTTRGVAEVDHLILATGYQLDWSLHPEYASFSDRILTWHDVACADVPRTFSRPYLRRDFSLQPRVVGELAGVERIYCFNNDATASCGHVTGLIAGISTGARRLAQAVAGAIAREQSEAWYQRILACEELELTGDEWQPDLQWPHELAVSIGTTA